MHFLLFWRRREVMKKTVSESRVYKSSRIFPPDLNSHGTLFGGKLLADMDMLASIAATRHARLECVTVSMDTVEFLHPITEEDSIHYEAFVIWTGKSSMEVFVKVTAEHLLTGANRIAATCFISFVALLEGKPRQVPGIEPETEGERQLNELARKRAQKRMDRKVTSKNLAEILTKL
ncbi:acyl-CoA thioesterase [Guptibacillus hwajinpoensis]|uniref:acyl-CoA thioesterase n=1 Tax=Guptibacillus hwajinpoensis TaxID=208199 RepID=UPI003CD0C70D